MEFHVFDTWNRVGVEEFAKLLYLKFFRVVIEGNDINNGIKLSDVELWCSELSDSTKDTRTFQSSCYPQQRECCARTEPSLLCLSNIWAFHRRLNEKNDKCSKQNEWENLTINLDPLMSHTAENWKKMSSKQPRAIQGQVEIPAEIYLTF